MEKKDNKFEVIFAIVNAGFAQKAMEAARDEGARGGTIISARGTGTKEMEKKYGIIITPNKELLMILVKDDIKDNVLTAIYRSVGIGTDGQGIAFSLPVDDVVGLRFEVTEEEQK